MSAYRQVANGDTCPTEPEHGVMYVLADGRQFCAHSFHSCHSETAVYEYDGTTPIASGIPVSRRTPSGGSPRRRTRLASLLQPVPAADDGLWAALPCATEPALTTR